MVTTSTTETTAVTGIPAAGQRTGSDGDDSLFAQLLVDAGVSASAASGSKAGNGKSSARADSDIAQPVVPSADMLALCGLPVSTPVLVPPTATSTQGVEGDDKSFGVSADTMGTLAQAFAAASAPPPEASVAVNTEVEPATVDGVDGKATRPASRTADLQWLQGSLPGNPAKVVTTTNSDPRLETGVGADVDAVTQLNSQIAQPAQQLSGHQTNRQSAGQLAEQSTQHATQQVAGQSANRTVTGSENAMELPVVSDNKVSPEQQPGVQKLLAQVTPMMGVMAAQLREDGFDQPSEIAVNDAQSASGALSAASLQPAGTQLVSDAPAFEVSPRHYLQATVGSHQWATELGNKLTMMATRDTQSATLYMTPADLGPVQVRIDLNQDQASVWFTAEHAETRSALEQSLPKLREMFTAQGMSLTDAGVFGDRSRQQQTDNGFTSARFVSSQYEDSEALADTATVRSISMSLLDAYA